jgi:hypothetical protein
VNDGGRHILAFECQLRWFHFRNFCRWLVKSENVHFCPKELCLHVRNFLQSLKYWNLHDFTIELSLLIQLVKIFLKGTTIKKYSQLLTATHNDYYVGLHLTTLNKWTWWWSCLALCMAVHANVEIHAGHNCLVFGCLKSVNLRWSQNLGKGTSQTVGFDDSVKHACKFVKPSVLYGL